MGQQIINANDLGLVARDKINEMFEEVYSGGLVGVQGPPGADGQDGADGAPGAPGLPGPTSDSIAFESRAAAAAATIPTPGSGGANYLITNGHSSADDGGQGNYARGAAGVTEASPTFTATNGSGSYTGHSASGGAGMRDGIDNASNSVFGSNGSSPITLRADLGSSQYVAYITLRPIPNSFDDWGHAYLDGALIQTSPDGSTWTTITGVSETRDGYDKSFAINATCRYIRLYRTTWLAVAEFRVFLATSGIAVTPGGFKSADGQWWNLVPAPYGYGVNVKQFGAAGDGTVDDSRAIQEACDYYLSGGGGIIYFPRGTYRVDSPMKGWGSITAVGEGKDSIILGYGAGEGSDRSFSIATGLGSTIHGENTGYPLGEQVTERKATGAVSPGIVALTWDDVSGLAAGDEVFVWLGISEADVSTPVWAGFQYISSVVGSVVTFADPIFKTIPDPTTVDTGGSSLGFPKPLDKVHRMWKPIHKAENCGFEKLHLRRDPDSGNIGYNMAAVKNARNVHFSDIWGFRPTLSILFVATAENVVVERFFAERVNFNFDYPQGGSGLAGGTIRNLILRDSTINADGIAVYFEGHNRGLLIENTSFACRNVNPNFPQFIQFAGETENGTATVRNCRFRAAAYRRLIAGSDGLGKIILDGIDAEGEFTLDADGSIGALRLTQPDGTSAYVRAPVTYRKSIALSADMDNATYLLPHGWLVGFSAFASSLTGITGVTLYQLGDGVGLGENVLAQLDDAGPELIQLSGSQLRVQNGSASILNPVQTSHQLVISTDGTVPGGAFLSFEFTYYPFGFDASNLQAYSPTVIAAAG